PDLLGAFVKVLDAKTIELKALFAGNGAENLPANVKLQVKIYQGVTAYTADQEPVEGPHIYDPEKVAKIAFEPSMYKMYYATVALVDTTKTTPLALTKEVSSNSFSAITQSILPEPTNVQAGKSTDTKLELTWNKVDGATSYLVTILPLLGGNAVNVEVKENNVVVQGLLPCTRYNARVTAIATDKRSFSSVPLMIETELPVTLLKPVSVFMYSLDDKKAKIVIKDLIRVCHTLYTIQVVNAQKPEEKILEFDQLVSNELTVDLTKAGVYKAVVVATSVGKKSQATESNVLDMPPRTTKSVGSKLALQVKLMNLDGSDMVFKPVMAEQKSPAFARINEQFCKLAQLALAFHQSSLAVDMADCRVGSVKNGSVIVDGSMGLDQINPQAVAKFTPSSFEQALVAGLKSVPPEELAKVGTAYNLHSIKAVLSGPSEISLLCFFCSSQFRCNRGHQSHHSDYAQLATGLFRHLLIHYAHKHKQRQMLSIALFTKIITV
ncbi:hypothetical protein Ciccas_010977, partial [Cichlidogyrus casuarinus]